MKTKLWSNKVFAAFGALFCCALWGISTPIVKMGYAYTDAAHVPSLLLWVGLQFLVAGLLTICLYSLACRKFRVPQKKSLKGVGIIALLQTVVQYICLYAGLLYTTSVKGAILKSTDVFFVVLIASLLFKMEKLTAKKLIACIIGFAGIIVMNLNGLSLNVTLGDGLVVLGILAYSFAVVMTKIFAKDEDPIVLCGYQMSVGGGIMLLIGLVLGGKMDFVGMLPIFAILSAIYGVSYTLWTVLLKYNPASGVTIYSFMTPVFGVAFSALLLNEEGGVAIPNLMLSLALVCFGILLWGYQKNAVGLKKS